MKYYLTVIKKYAQFSGRAGRSEYWYFVLFNIIFAVAAMLIDMSMGAALYGAVYGLYTLFVLLPGLAAAVRRLHDVNKSGWFLLVAFIPLIGAIWLLVVLATAGDEGPNKYGLGESPEFEFEQQPA